MASWGSNQNWWGGQDWAGSRQQDQGRGSWQPGALGWQGGWQDDSQADRQVVEVVEVVEVVTRQASHFGGNPAVLATSLADVNALAMAHGMSGA